MPTVEITQKQYDLLQSGASIVVEPKPKKIKNVLLVPQQKSNDWHHIYFVFEGSLRPDGTHIDLLDFVHLTNAYGNPVGLERRQSTTSSLSLYESRYGFKIIDPNEN